MKLLAPAAAGLILVSTVALAAPDEELLGKSQGYPVCPIALAPTEQRCLVGMLSHFDTLVPARKVAKGAKVFELKRAPNEAKISYGYQGRAGDTDSYQSNSRNTGLLVLTDEPRRTAASPMNFLWTTFTRFEPAADIHAAGKTIVRNQVAFRAPIVIDARRKRGFPDELRADPETARVVTERWSRYFPGGRVEMGDSDAASLDKP